MERRTYRTRPGGGMPRKSATRSALFGRIFLALSIGIVFVVLMSLLWQYKAQPPEPQNGPSPKQRLVKEIPRTALPEPQTTPLENAPPKAAQPEEPTDALPSSPAGKPPPEPESSAEKKTATPLLSTSIKEKPIGEAPRPPKLEAEAGAEKKTADAASQREAPEGGTSASSEAKRASSPEAKKGESKTASETAAARKGWQYVVQVGAFSKKENAERMQNRLKKNGFEARISRFHHRKLGWLYLVRLEPVSTRSQAEKIAREVGEIFHTKALILKVAVRKSQ